MPTLQASFDRAWRDIGAQSSGAVLCEALTAAYAEPQRKYHTLQHLSECLQSFDAVRHLAGKPAEVELALWFHDAVYQVKRGDNEEMSADWARRELNAAGVHQSVVDCVHQLVMVTRHDVLPSQPDEQLLVDIDLSILGAPEERFAQYEQQIREEYAFVPAWIFRRKRVAILKSFMDRPRIFSTGHFYAALEQRARANLLRAVS